MESITYYRKRIEMLKGLIGAALTAFFFPLANRIHQEKVYLTHDGELVQVPTDKVKSTGQKVTFRKIHHWILKRIKK
ncbi:hypothetical protein [Marinoscillum sp. MHG1-6]|uniref:hypothetical protein n=1 Tax=Marinoscillum sp. MHG1-6 TaxID=2959627 RepID=UPI002157F346|nr:hypothetical protein [Marinoscillum sp. MHG1-6]